MFLSSENDSTSSPKSSIYNNGNSWSDDSIDDNDSDDNSILLDSNVQHLKNPFTKDQPSPGAGIAGGGERERIDKLQNELIRIQVSFECFLIFECFCDF